MTDRTPTYPGRVKLTPVPGAQNTFDMTLADVPVVEGTPLNKSTLLQDSTAAMMGLDTDATVDDEFKAVIAKMNGLITCGTADLRPNVSSLATGTVYLMYT